jgi:hypothetical protein
MAAWMDRLPFTLDLPGRGVMVVHGGFDPGRSLQGQSLWDMLKLRDGPGCGEGYAARPSAGGDCEAAAPEDGTPWAAAWCGVFDSRGREQQHGSRACTRHVVFGHDSPRCGRLTLAPRQRRRRPLLLQAAPGSCALCRRKRDAASGSEERMLPPGRPAPPACRRLQVWPWATGIDTGCVSGDRLTALVLPPLDAKGRPDPSRAGLPEGKPAGTGDARGHRRAGGAARTAPGVCS